MQANKRESQLQRNGRLSRGTNTYPGANALLPPGPPRLDGVKGARGRRGHGGPGRAIGAWRRTALFSAAGAEPAHTRLPPAVAARGLVAVAAVWPPAGLESVPPGLEVEAASRQRPSQGQDRFFALHGG